MSQKPFGTGHHRQLRKLLRGRYEPWFIHTHFVYNKGTGGFHLWKKYFIATNQFLISPICKTQCRVEDSVYCTNATQKQLFPLETETAWKLRVGHKHRQGIPSQKQEARRLYEADYLDREEQRAAAAAERQTKVGWSCEKMIQNTFRRARDQRTKRVNIVEPEPEVLGLGSRQKDLIIESERQKNGDAPAGFDRSITMRPSSQASNLTEDLDEEKYEQNQTNTPHCRSLSFLIQFC